MEDILIDIFIGRDPGDLRQPDQAYQRNYSLSMMGRSLASLVIELTTSRELKSALITCTEGIRVSQLIDQAAVQQDVEEIKRLMRMAFPLSQAFFDILLRRSEAHIAQIAIYY